MLTTILLCSILLAQLAILVGLKNDRGTGHGHFCVLKRKVDQIMAKVSELPALLDAITSRVDTAVASLDEGITEVKAEIRTLKEALGDVELPEAAQESLNRLDAKVVNLGARSEEIANISPQVGGVEVPDVPA